MEAKTGGFYGYIKMATNDYLGLCDYAF